jgi:2-keto-4-pentenoate hydratase/2-oxohepta-3-ene-1,7-dioic acid hydratase in catechol pathway
MKYCRFLLDDEVLYGAVKQRDGEPWIVDLARAPEEDLAFRLTHGRATALGLGFEPLPLSAATLLPPVTPSKIVCVGRNYRDHVKEMGSELPSEPLLFLKPPSSLLAPGGIIRMPAASARVDYEGELALVVGRRVRNLKAENWRDAIRGYTLANDVTAAICKQRTASGAAPRDSTPFAPSAPSSAMSSILSPASPLKPVSTASSGSTAQRSTSSFPFPSCWPTSPASSPSNPATSSSLERLPAWVRSRLAILWKSPSPALVC